MIQKFNKIEEMYNQNGYEIITQDGSDTFSLLNDENDAAKKELKSHYDYIAQHGIPSPHVKTSTDEKVPQKTLDIGGAASISYDIPTIVENLNWHMNRIAENVIGRDEIIRQSIFAIITGEHMLLLSRTGMAKSYLANYIFNTFEGARVFSSQASKDQTPDNYFGPYNMEEFKKGRIRHNIKGSIIEANLVFLDEFFDASDVVLRALLSVLNERKFVNGSEQIDAAVHSAIATANYMRMNEVTEAVLDRFTYKSIIPEDNDVYSQLLIDHTYAFSHGKPKAPEKKIFFEQILYLTDIIQNKNKEYKVEIPDFVYFMKNVVVNKFISDMRKSDHNFFISPRKQAKVSDFLKANALIKNRFEVELEDLKELYLSLCTLNSYISVKMKDKSEKDVYLDAYNQTMIHFNATGALPQVEFLLNVRKVFQELRENPEKLEEILEKKGIIQGLLDLLKKILPSRKSNDEEAVTIESLKKSIVEINPAVEEVRELKNGILKDYRDLY